MFSVLALGYVAYPVPTLPLPSGLDPISLAGWALTNDANLHSYVDGAQSGVNLTRALISSIRAKCPNSWIIGVGYSQGAWAMDRVAATTPSQTIGITPAFVLLADPAQKAGDNVSQLQIHPKVGYNWVLGGTENGIATLLGNLPVQPSWASKYELMSPRTMPGTGLVFSVCADNDLVCDPNALHLPSGATIHTTYYLGYSDKADADAMNSVGGAFWNPCLPANTTRAGSVPNGC
jgi:Cutinase